MRTIVRSFLGLLLVAGGYSSAGAGGLYLNEFATPSMGVAGAGQEAVANDASTNFAFHNPAGMTRLEGHSIALGAGLLQGDTEFDTDPDTPFNGGDGGDQAGWAPHSDFGMERSFRFWACLTLTRRNYVRVSARNSKIRLIRQLESRPAALGRYNIYAQPVASQSKVWILCGAFPVEQSSGLAEQRRSDH